MDRRKFNAWWETILRGYDDLTETDRLALAHLHGAESHFALAPLPEHPIRLRLPAGFDQKQAAFRTLETAELPALRSSLHARKDTQITARWAEALLRFCEINCSSLKRRACTKWGDPEHARLELLQLAAFLLDNYFCADDLRFLNCVLKLLDLGWLAAVHQIGRRLKGKGSARTTALLQVRLLILCQFALDRLSEEAAA